MKRFTTLEELQEARLHSGIVGALTRALHTEGQIAHPQPYNPEDGSVWLLERTDTDATVAAIFGSPPTSLPFERVSYHPDEEHFLCYLVRNNSRCDTLVIPDADWLADEWRECLLGQL